MSEEMRPPATKYRLTVEISGNSHDEIEQELGYLARGGYLLNSDHHERDEFHVVGGRLTATLRHTNPEQTPEGYKRELDEWFTARKAVRAEEGR